MTLFVGRQLKKNTLATYLTNNYKHCDTFITFKQTECPNNVFPL